ncbi:hypothetical protein [uncultured Rheinheimera sp.]|uniref:hypothetical protein n=1 Tax=uncultured Rheinheimera sp. TaxID=400532 RepID=UPI002592ADA0|nr:hypothetical protein [uncultured Rheinheimera sp.]
MLKSNNGEFEQYRASGIGELLRIVIEQFHIHCSIVREVYETYGKIPDGKILEEQDLSAKSQSIISTVFSGMVIEAFYFDYYQDKNSKTKAEKWSKQSPIKQFESIAAEYLKVDNVTELELHKKLEKFGKVRIYWVHNKSTKLGSYSKALEHSTADGNIQMLRELFEFFAVRDEEYEPSKVFFDLLTELQLNVKGYSGA